jgi:arginyl-tRNA--protein-N-Asp/Glu arginylyltransferase
LPGREERKVFTHLVGRRAIALNDALTASGFRRSQTIAYRPACEDCSACVSVRVLVDEFSFTRNMRRVLVSDQAGKSNVLAELERLGVDVAKDDPRVGRLLDEVKERESLGYAYEGADASFELLALRALGQVPQYFDIESYKVTVERKKGVTISEGTVQLDVAGEKLTNVGRGNGPVNALDAALDHARRGAIASRRARGTPPPAPGHP